MLIGHVDSGVERDDPHLQHRIAHFRAINRQGQSTTPLLPRDYGTHGTTTASILFGDEYPGLPSLPPETKLCSIALESQRTAILQLAAAIDTLLQFEIRIAFMPIGIQQLTPIFVPLIEALCQRGILVIVPVGNVGPGRACAPGFYPQVLSVGAMNQQGYALAHSGSHRDAQGHCQKPDILAPGCGLSSAKAAQGTSIASAYVAGVAARLWHAHPEASAQDIWQAIVSTAKPLGQTREKSRWGALQPEKALASLDAPSVSVPSRPANDWGPYLDPRLEKQCQGKPLDALVEALVVPKAWRDGPNGEAHRLIDGVMRSCGETPVSIRRFVHAEMVQLTASRRFHDALQKHPGFLMGSAVDVDVVYFDGG